MHTPNVRRNQHSNAAVPHTSPYPPFFTRAPPCVTLRRGLHHRAGKEGCITVYLDPGKERCLCALNDEIYLDKSGIIGLINRTLSTPEGYICMTKPRRFGKTVTANMLAAYYDCSCDSHDIFDTLEIAKHPSYEKHLNHYNVIQVDVQGMRDRVGKEDFEHKFSLEILKDMHEKWPDIVNRVIQIPQTPDFC